jgi:hypothetical protein
LERRRHVIIGTSQESLNLIVFAITIDSLLGSALLIENHHFRIEDRAQDLHLCCRDLRILGVLKSGSANPFGGDAACAALVDTEILAGSKQDLYEIPSTAGL